VVERGSGGAEGTGGRVERGGGAGGGAEAGGRKTKGGNRFGRKAGGGTDRLTTSGRAKPVATQYESSNKQVTGFSPLSIGESSTGRTLSSHSPGIHYRPSFQKEKSLVVRGSRNKQATPDKKKHNAPGPYPRSSERCLKSHPRHHLLYRWGYGESPSPALALGGLNQYFFT